MPASYHIQYHNADKLKRLPSKGINFTLDIKTLELDNSVIYDDWIYTTKPIVEQAIGDYCFLIVGKGNDKKEYYLWSFFKIREYDIDENKNYIVYGLGHNLKRPVLLNHLPHFDELKKYCGNFGLGFQDISSHPFREILSSYCKEEYILKNMGQYSLPTVLQYEEIIQSHLSSRQIDLLIELYHFPNSRATASQLADALGYKSHLQINKIIGGIGKKFSKNTGLIPDEYENKGSWQPAYYTLIGLYYQNGGWLMWKELREALENLELVSPESETNLERLPTEASVNDENKYLKDGKLVKTYVNRYERNREAREKCIEHYGAACQACGFDFGKVYGKEAEGFIHVHHLKPLGELKKEYIVDPIKDLRPVCANCHSVIHLDSKKTKTIEEVRKMVQKKNR